MHFDDEIVIVGVGCRFPGANNLREYWRVLSNGENHVKEIPKERWNVDAFYDKDVNAPGKTYVRKAGLVDRFDEWDHQFFGINDKEAEVMDPQQRMVLDCVHMALEEGGITRKDINGTNSGVYIGIMNDDYKNFVGSDPEISSNYSVTGTHRSITSARVSYCYNLFGPAITIDTACSSSLVAINLGSQALREGECDMAICGGANTILDPNVFIMLSKARMLSPTGQCQTYSKTADGYARGEGCGIVILKRLKDAIKDGNNIRAKVVTSTNQDGRATAPITAPSGKQQKELLERIYSRHKIDKQTVQVIEAHGTGTPIGDPVEANALGQFFNIGASSRDVYIGSVKTNIGHLEAAAGVAGLIKVLLMMEHQTLVPSLMYTKENENPAVKLKSHNFVVPITPKEWKPINERRVGCVNSFGFGGTNAHAIVTQHDSRSGRHTSQFHQTFRLPSIVAVSALDKNALKETVRNVLECLKHRKYDIHSLSYTSTCCRDHQNCRKAFIAESQEQLIKLCDQYVKLPVESATEHNKRKVVFVFCGVGTAWKGMCKSLMKNSSFNAAIQLVDKYLHPLTGWTIASKFSAEVDVVADPFLNHIAIFSCQVGLVNLWKSAGVIPDAVVGQSVGEVAAAYASGHIELETAVKIIYYRSKLLAGVTGGGMAFVKSVPTEVVEKLCSAKNGQINIAVYNSPTSCTVAGDKSAIAELKGELEKQNEDQGTFLDLNVKCAYHSPHVEKICKGLAESLKHTKSVSYLSKPMFSTVTGKQILNGRLGAASYWVENVRKPVLFCDAVREANVHVENKSIFLEIGPNPVLRSHLNDIFPDGKDIIGVPTMKKDTEISSLTQAISTLFEHGIDITWSGFLPPCSTVTDIPAYVFRRNRILYRNPDLLLENQGFSTLSSNHMYIERRLSANMSPAFRATINSSTTPFVFEHVVKERVLVPGAFHADIGFEIGKHTFQANTRKMQIGLEFLKMIRIESMGRVILDITCADVEDNKIDFHVQQKGSTMVKGSVRLTSDICSSPDKLDFQQIRFDIMKHEFKTLTGNELYENLEELGFKYGKSFRVISHAISGKDSTLATFEVCEEVISHIGITTFHPCILDGILQSTMLGVDEEILSMIKEEGLSFLPVAIEQINLLKTLEKKMMLYTKRTKATILDTVMKLQFDMILCDSNGFVIAVIHNYTTYSRRKNQSAPDELKYALSWKPLNSIVPDEDKRDRVLIIANMQDNLPELENVDNWIFYRTSFDQPREKFISEILTLTSHQWGSIEKLDVIAVLFDKYLINNADATDSSAVYRQMKMNIEIVIALLRFLITKEIRKPIFIATQNTQCLFDNQQAQVNIIGSEVWGLIRSVQTEFVTGQMTMVDMQPSIKENVSVFKSVIQTEPEHIAAMKTELIMLNGNIYGAEFSKTAMYDPIPMLCTMNQNGDDFPSKICSVQRATVKDPYLLPRIDKTLGDFRHKPKNSVAIQITSVFRHSSILFPEVTNSTKVLPLEGYTLFGIEYAGIEIDSGIKMCKGSRIEPGSEDVSAKWETIAIYPAEMKNYMTVPRSCTVSSKELDKFYKPGLLLDTVLATYIVKNIPVRSSVALVENIELRRLVDILKSMMSNRRTGVKCWPIDSVTEKDTLVLLSPHTECLNLIQKANTVIYLKGAMPDIIIKQMMTSEIRRFIELDPKQAFSNSTIGSILKSSVKWLKNNHSKLEQHEAPRTTREEAKSLTVTQNGTYILPYKMPMTSMFLKSGCYIITGGLTGLGWELLLTIAEMGGGTIATLSRRNPSEAQLDEINMVESNFSCKVVCLQGDVTNFKDVNYAIQTLRSTKGIGSLRGVFHGAGVLDSALLVNIEEKHLDNVMAAKIQGALNLHTATMGIKLDFFVVQSSITSILGVPGQGNYGAANAFLDAFALWRRQKGLAGQSINWGALEVGMAANSDFSTMFQKRGYHLLTKAEIRSCFQQALLQNETGAIFTSLDWNLVAKDYANSQMIRLRLKMANAIQEKSVETIDLNETISQQNFDVEALRLMDPESQKEALRTFITAVAKRVLESVEDNLRLDASFAEIGMDSMSAVTFSNIVYDITGCRLNLSFIMDQNNTLEGVVSYLMENICAAVND